MLKRQGIHGLLVAVLLCGIGCVASAASAATGAVSFPPPLDSYGDAGYSSLWEILRHRVEFEPFNLWATLLFAGAVLHTFFTHKFRHWAHHVEERHRLKQAGRQGAAAAGSEGPKTGSGACMPARLLHFFGEVEVVFGMWVVPLVALMIYKVGAPQATQYLNYGVHYTEPLFVVIIMTIASTQPVLRLAEACLHRVAGLGGGRPVAWWLSILTLGPLLGSLITEPAAMTISASLLARRFYELKPRAGFAYATLGLLFVNVSVGGVLTHFAAPPVLMVAGRWGWGTPYMLAHFGWIALVGILVSNAGYLAVFRRDFAQLAASATMKAPGDSWADAPIPVWVTVAHLLAMGWAVWQAHHPVMLIGGFLFFMAFVEVTEEYQSALQIRPAILVGFFLAGLVVHGGLQQWWIAPVLSRLGELPLMLGAIFLTSFNDNAAITYLASLVPGMGEAAKYAVVAGAVIGGGLTVIANAPNPAGQALLGRFFSDGIAPLRLFLGALPATVIMALVFILLRGIG